MVYLILNDYHKNSITLKIENTNIMIKYTIEHIRFYFKLDINDNFLVNFLVFWIISIKNLLFNFVIEIIFISL